MINKSLNSTHTANLVNGGVADTASFASNCGSASDTGVPVQSLYRYVVKRMTAEHLYPCVFVCVCMLACVHVCVIIPVCICGVCFRGEPSSS